MKLQSLQTNMTGGELSPSLGGRVDVAKYNNAVVRMENFHPRVQGGAKTRGGSIHVGEARTAGRLIPFVYSRTLSFQIELTPLALRIWRVGDRTQIINGLVPLELVTPYDSLGLWSLNYEQAEDTMFLFHQGFMPRRLQRLDDQTWRLDAAPFVVQPFDEQGLQPAVSATLSAATVGTGRTITASAAVFLASDKGRDVIANFGSGTITAVTSSTVATLDIDAAFLSTALAAGTWTLDGSPQAFIYAASAGPAGSNVRIDAATPRAATVAVSDAGNDGDDDPKGTVKTLTASVSIFTAADIGKTFYADAGVVLISAQTGVTATGTLTSEADFLTHSYEPGSWGITGDAFRAGDVGSYISDAATGALYRITSVTNATSVQAAIRTKASALIASPPGSWSLEGNSWTTAGGYPTAGALFEQRLWVGGTRTKPQKIWASAIGEYLNFESGTGDADAFSYTLNTHQRNLIRHLSYTTQLFALTEGLEVSFRGGNEKAIGPTNIQKSNQSAYGTGGVRPVAIGKELMFVQGAGLKIRALGYDAASDGFNSPDRTVFSEHITKSGVTDMAYQAEPDSLLYAVRADGQMAVCAYSIDQEVVGWSRYLTQGLYRSVSVVPVVGFDEVWTLVQRSIAGVDRYFIEVLSETVNTDCCVVQEATPHATWSGLDHLEGQTVAAKADGINQGTFVVSGGKVTLPRTATAVEIGLARPLPTIEPLPVEVAGSTGTHEGSNLSIHQVIVRVLETETLSINGQTTDFRRFGTNLLDRPPPGYTGDYSEIVLSDDLYKPGLVITQPLPYPAHVLSIVRKVSANDT
jgi:hypothetical protein